MQNNMDVEQAFKDVEKMLYKLAWNCHHTYGVDYNDALSECYWAFVKAINWRWDPKKDSKFSTTVQTIATWRLKSLIISRANAVPMVEINEEVAGEAPPERAESLELICDLGEDAKELVRLILEAPADLLGRKPLPPKQYLKRIKEYLVKQGRAREDVEMAHRMLKRRFQEAWA